MGNKIRLEHSTIIITLRCTLHCKLCSAFVPCYDIPPHYNNDLIAKTYQKLFETVDFIEKFTLTGGEPLLHEDLPKMIEGAYKYAGQFGRLQIITNGTLLPSPGVLEAICRHKNNIYVIVDHYGALSTKINDLEKMLKENQIQYEIRKYYGKDAYCGGWVDYGDLSRHNSDEYVEILSHKCATVKMGYTWGVWNGVLHPCCTTSRLSETNSEYAQQKKDYINLFDDKLSLAEKREKINDILTKPFLEACYYCDGICADSKRYSPAEQV